MVGGETGCQQKPLAIKDHRGNKLFRRTFDLPNHLSVGRIKTSHVPAARHDHLVLPVNRAYDRRHIAADALFTSNSPNGFSRFFIECHYISVPIMIPVQDHEVLVKDRATAESRSEE